MAIQNSSNLHPLLLGSNPVEKDYSHKTTKNSFNISDKEPLDFSVEFTGIYNNSTPSMPPSSANGKRQAGALFHDPGTNSAQDSLKNGNLFPLGPFDELEAFDLDPSSSAEKQASVLDPEQAVNLMYSETKIIDTSARLNIEILTAAEIAQAGAQYSRALTLASAVSEGTAENAPKQSFSAYKFELGSVNLKQESLEMSSLKESQNLSEPLLEDLESENLGAKKRLSDSAEIFAAKLKNLKDKENLWMIKPADKFAKQSDFVASQLVGLTSSKELDGGQTTAPQSQLTKDASQALTSALPTPIDNGESTTKLAATSKFVQGLNLQQSFSPNLALRIQWMFNQALSSAEILMDPPDLGPLTVKIKQHNGETNIFFQVSNPATKEALEDNLGKLKDLLQQQGVTIGQAEVEQQQQNSADAEKPNQQEPQRQADQAAGTEAIGSDQAVSSAVSEQLIDVYS